MAKKKLKKAKKLTAAKTTISWSGSDGVHKVWTSTDFHGLSRVWGGPFLFGGEIVQGFSKWPTADPLRLCRNLAFPGKNRGTRGGWTVL